MHVSSEDIKRNAAQGKALVAEVFGGYLGKAIYKTVTGTWKKDAEGKKYKVDTEGDWFKKANEKEKSQYVEKRKEEASRSTSNKIDGHEIDDHTRKSMEWYASGVSRAADEAIAELNASKKYSAMVGDMSSLSKSDQKYLNKQINTLAKADVSLQRALLYKEKYANNVSQITQNTVSRDIERATAKYNEAKAALNSSIKTLKSANNKSNQQDYWDRVERIDAESGAEIKRLSQKHPELKKYDINGDGKNWDTERMNSEIKNATIKSELKKIQDNANKKMFNLEQNNSESAKARDKLLKLSYSDRDKAYSNARQQSAQNFSRARAMRNSGMTYSEIAKKLGVSESTVWAMVTDEG